MRIRKYFDIAIQYAKFGGVGVLATAIHITVFAALVEIFDAQPLIANVWAFIIAVAFAFVGHFNWTFKSETKLRFPWLRQQTRAFARFILIALLGLGLNSLSVFLVVDVVELSYLYAILPMVFVVPPIVFVISKYWGFSLI